MLSVQGPALIPLPICMSCRVSIPSELKCLPFVEHRDVQAIPVAPERHQTIEVRANDIEQGEPRYLIPDRNPERLTDPGADFWAGFMGALGYAIGRIGVILYLPYSNSSAICSSSLSILASNRATWISSNQISPYLYRLLAFCQAHHKFSLLEIHSREALGLASTVPPEVR